MGVERSVNLQVFFCFEPILTICSTVLDANSVPESGLTDGNIQFLGSFEQCLDQKVPEDAFDISPDCEYSSFLAFFHVRFTMATSVLTSHR